jgi:hypothetical protein
MIFNIHPDTHPLIRVIDLLNSPLECTFLHCLPYRILHVDYASCSQPLEKHK